tara:strand:- start:457 stop:636 length:180 start_codon:yes stop_codon:yes gene_type:complete
MNNYDRFNEQWQKAKLKLKELNLYDPAKVKEGLERAAMKVAESRIATKYLYKKQGDSDE